LTKRRIGYPKPKNEKNQVVLGSTYGDIYENSNAMTAIILRL
jgi:hypothetical protein